MAKREAEKWTWDTELLAVNAEVTHMLLQSFVRANSKPGTNPGKPLRIPRPSDRQEPEPATRVDGAGLMAWLAGG